MEEETRKFKCPHCGSWIGICCVCEDMRKFKFNKATGHSECVECGASFAERVYLVRKKDDE